MKIKIIFASLAGIMVAFVIYFVFRRPSSPPTVNLPTPSFSAVPSPSSAPAINLGELTTRQDQAGFTIKYPKNLTLNDHPEDNDSYSHLEFTSDQNPGRLLLMASDTKYQKITDWVKDPSLAAGNIIDTTVGGQPAKKIILDSKLILGAISDQILFTLEIDPPQNPFWQTVFDQISSSFEFYAPTQSSSSSQSPQDIPLEEDTSEE